MYCNAMLESKLPSCQILLWPHRKTCLGLCVLVIVCSGTAVCKMERWVLKQQHAQTFCSKYRDRTDWKSNLYRLMGGSTGVSSGVGKTSQWCVRIVTDSDVVCRMITGPNCSWFLFLHLRTFDISKTNKWSKLYQSRKCHEGVKGNVDTATFIRNVDIRWSSVISFTLRLLYSLRYPLNISLVFPYDRFGSSGEDVSKRLAPVGNRIRIAELCITKQTNKQVNKQTDK